MLALMLLFACSAAADKDDPTDTGVADTDTDTDDTDTDDTDTDTDDTDSGDTDTEDTDTGPDELPLGADCDPDDDRCAGDTLCCTACCLDDTTPVCTERDVWGSCPLPNLSVDLPTFTASVDLQDVWVEEDSCGIEEGCTLGSGWRRLLKFGVTTPNDGTADLFLGDPSRGDGFEYSVCHDHFHMTGYATYELLDATGAVVASGRKQAFCLMDYEPWSDTGTEPPRYDCGFQGISVGWADTYSAYLDCQWLDVTDTPPGDYTLRVAVNPNLDLPEQDYTDNEASAPVTIADWSALPPVTDACDHTAYGIGRSCGWESAGTFECTPGEPVTVACEGACDGTCVADTVLRVCPADDPDCQARDALAWNDDAACASPCSVAELTCPPDGRVAALVGGWEAGAGDTCTVVVAY